MSTPRKVLSLAGESVAHRCSLCGSKEVERLFMIWIDANTFEHVEDFGPVLDGVGQFWCRTCERNPEHIDGDADECPSPEFAARGLDL